MCKSFGQNLLTVSSIFFAGQFGELSTKERAHAIGVVANTLAALAVNQARGIDADSMAATLGTLTSSSNETIESFVTDESAGLLFPQSLRICEIIREAVSKREA